MKSTKSVALGLVVLLVALAPSLTCAAKMLKGFRGIELGMQSEYVEETLKARGSGHDIIVNANTMSAAVRDNKLFRHAHYRFDDKGRLTEIVLIMREVLGRDRVLEELKKSYDLTLSTKRSVTKDGVCVTVKGNALSIERAEVAIVKAPTQSPTPVK